MMVKGRFEQFKLGVFQFTLAIGVSFFISSCATAKPRPIERQTADAKPLPIDVKEDIKTELSSNEVVAGTIVVATLRAPKDWKKTTIQGEFEGIQLPFFSAPELGEGVFETVLGVPYDRKPGPAAIKVSMTDGVANSDVQIPFQVVEGNYPSEILHVDKRRVNPTNKKDLARIIKEQAEVAAIYKRVTPQKYWPGRFSLPIQSKITSPFGTRRIYNGQLKNFHPGLDLKAAIKTPIFAAAPGVVVLAKNLFYTGNTVMIDHGYGIITLYAHMSKLGVKEGQTVKDHELLGLSGKTGRVNGPHLHWQAVVHRVKVNPLGLTQVVR